MFTNKTLELTKPYWIGIAGREELATTVIFNDREIPLIKTDFSCSESYSPTVLSMYLIRQLCTVSQVGNSLRVIEKGNNYVVYEETYYDEYNGCYQSLSYIAVYDNETTYLYSGVMV